MANSMILSKKAKNQYSWKGFGAMPRALEKLKVILTHTSGRGNTNKRFSIVYMDSLGFDVVIDRKEKSLRLLSQNFIKLFLRSDVDLICLDDAAMALHGDAHNSTTMRTKVRRLYDIANVLSSMNLIEKIQHPENRKPVFRWLGMKENRKNGSATALDMNESRKRVFGTQITNYISKRSKVDSSSDWKINQKKTMQMHLKHGDLENDYNRNELEQHSKHSSKGFVYGPFTPVSVTKVGGSENSSVRQVQDWESLASTYCPQYRNQALSDLFAHYVEAWKSWYDEVSQKMQIQQFS
ncbi:hypothetical protein L1049_002566 [Liquidambar formosana]|uniref:E2F/DP family winged-helix DNA-binding domain-containing protein n=1 Tax=Liquidambar formosana TaxID=63359 RepID=A0AAP0NI39_LIQFO